MSSLTHLVARARHRGAIGLRSLQRRFTRRSGRPQILVIIDSPGWAHDFKSQNLRRHLADEFDLIVVPQNEVLQRDLDRADLVLIYYVKQLEILLRRGHRLSDNVLIGVCSHRDFMSNDEFEGQELERRGPELVNKHARAVFANSAMLVDEFAPLFDVPTYYTPNGVDTSFFTPPGAGEAPSVGSLRVGWAGTLATHGSEKGYYDYIVPATDMAGATLVTAAREDRWRGPAEMRDFYRGIDVYVCASLSEGTPNPCLEAAACGIPLITTAVGNMPEFVSQGVNGQLVGRDTVEIAAALLELAADPDRRQRMGNAARASAEGWDWSHQAEPYRQLFRDALSNKLRSSL